MAAVSFSVESMPVSTVDLILTVTYGPGKLGELRISKGGVDWWPAGSHTKKISHRWGAFAALLESVEPKTGVRVPKRAPRKRPRKVATAPRG
jgi:hypothetical protein